MRFLIAFAFFFIIYNCVESQIYFSEDFETGNALTTDLEWVVTDYNTISGEFFYPEEHTEFLAFAVEWLDDPVSPIESTKAYFGPVDLSSATSPSLRFEAHFPDLDWEGKNEYFKIYYSYNSTDWVELLEVDEIYSWEEVFIDLNSFVGEENLYIAFEYSNEGGYNSGIGIDDILVSEFSVMNDIKFLNTFSTCGAGAVGTDVFFSGEIFNGGLNDLTSFDVVWSNGAQTEIETISGIEISTNEVYNFEHSVPFTLSEIGSSIITVKIENPNGVLDEIPDDNSSQIEVTGVPVLENQKIVVEEATGTWCAFCPRGEVWLKRMSNCFGDSFIGIAVHFLGIDPMNMPQYETDLSTAFSIGGIPVVVADREELIDPIDLEAPVVEKLAKNPDVVIGISADWDENSRTLDVTGSAEMNIFTTNGYKWVGVLTEDGVTGTGSQWNQANAFSGGSNGRMGGYENLPDPVPASMMVYNHVARGLLAGFGGAQDIGLENLEPGDQASYTFDGFVIPPDQNFENMHIIVMLVDPNGRIINANSVTTTEAILTNIEDIDSDIRTISVFPNPFKDMTNIKLALKESQNVSILVLNTLGQTVANKDYGVIQGDLVLPFYSHDLINGTYFIHISIDDERITKQIQITNK